MFNHIVNQQALADSLKALARRDNHARDARAAAVRLINQFERWQWQPQLFQKAFAAAAPGEFEFDAVCECFNRYAGTHEALSAAEAVIRVLERYADLLVDAGLLTPTAADGVEQRQFYDTASAAEYLGLTLDGIKRYIHRTKTLMPSAIVGKSFVFTRERLDEFAATMKPAGRPRKVTE